MSEGSRLTLHKGAAIAVAVALLSAGAGATYLMMRRRPAAAEHAGTTSTREAAAPAGAPQAPMGRAADDAPLPDVVVPLSQEAVERAGITTTTVAAGLAGADLRLPGVVEPNAYRQVAVTPLVAGRITRVAVALGDRVRRGQTMAQVYSPELAEAQTRYISARAMLDAHERELQRTQKLVAIGAASRQELERLDAEHAAQTAAVQSARSQLELLGVPASKLDAAASGQGVSAATSVPAPIDGVVTERAANVGLNVDPATRLFTVVDLSTVWVVADVYERDFSRVRVGTDANITTSAYPELILRGRVSYVDPQVSPETRTAKARVEVSNPRGELRLGMYADVSIAGAPSRPAAVVPRTSIQNIGDRTVVYLANLKEPGKYIEREVRVGASSGEQVEITSGLRPGDVIVAGGSFFIRAERDRLGLRPPIGGAEGAAAPAPHAGHGGAALQTARIVVSEQGFEPARITLRAGTPARVTFVRTTDKTCATEVVFPSLNIKRTLPLNEPVPIELTPEKTGDIAFVCGMNMLKGVVAVIQ